MCCRLRLDLRDHSDAQIGCRTKDGVLAFAADQYIGQHRHRALAVGNALGQVQSLEERILADCHLHRLFSTQVLLENLLTIKI